MSPVLASTSPSGVTKVMVPFDLGCFVNIYKAKTCVLGCPVVRLNTILSCYLWSRGTPHHGIDASASVALNHRQEVRR